MSQIGETALELALEDLAAGVRGGQTPYAPYRGPTVDLYQRTVGLALPPNISVRGFYWCAAAVYAWHQGAADQLGVPNPCPKSASARDLYARAAMSNRVFPPVPGCVFVLAHPDKPGGHTGLVEAVDANGLLTSVEGDTSNALESATGDAVGRHVGWDPLKRPGFTLVGYLLF